MTFKQLENLVKTGNLKAEPGDQTEFDGMIRSARARLEDAGKKVLSIESRFDLGYNAAHALALSALRWHGYRSDKRFTVFQCIPHTVGLGPEVWRVLSLCHARRNQAEYEGYVDIDEILVDDLIKAAHRLLEAVEKLGAIT